MSQLTFDIDSLLREADVAAADAWTGAPLHFTTYAYSPADLDAAFERWVFEHGNLGCIPFSHMWHGQDRYRRQSPTPVMVDGSAHSLLTYCADTRCNNFDRDHHRVCSCVGYLVYRTFCIECGWASEISCSDTLAAAAWHDHAMPGWRDLPVVAGKEPRVLEQQPTEWQFEGAPILTERGEHGIRAVPTRSPFRGYDFDVNTARPQEVTA